jgi:hypothetical protein
MLKFLKRFHSSPESMVAAPVGPSIQAVDEQLETTAGRRRGNDASQQENFVSTIERTFCGEPDSFMKVRHLAIRGSNFQIGKKLGELQIERANDSLENYRGDPVMIKARRLYFQRHYPIHWERIKGIADAFGADPTDNRYDFSGLPHNVSFPQGGCSVVYYPPDITSTSSGILSRNYDFSTGTVADAMHMPLDAEVKKQMSPVMSEPYIMEWHPEDGGYASLAIHAFDLVSGTLDGINEKGLTVSIMADEEAIAELGPQMEVDPTSRHVVGLHELQVMRWLLDTCANVEEAKMALLTVKQYYTLVPCHYMIADRVGASFVYENSTGRNAQYITDGDGGPQIVTNFQLYKHPTPDQIPQGPLTLETNAFWRYQKILERISEHEGLFAKDEIKENNAGVDIFKLLQILKSDPKQSSIAAGVDSRTLWHSLYNQNEKTAEFSFYLGEDEGANGVPKERRSKYFKFTLQV